MTNKPNKLSIGRKGFTLIEVLITVGVIAVITAASMSMLGQGPAASARNNRRKADLASIQQALETYRNDVGYYPTSSAPLVPNYIKQYPVDPKSGSYTYTGTGCAAGRCSGYSISATLENPTSTFTVGPI